MRFYLSLPRGYKAKPPRRWPVLVCVSGADSVFQHRLDNYRNARGDMPFLVVSPCTFSNTNTLEGLHLELYRRLYTDAEIEQAERGRLEWDEAGLLAVLDDLSKDYGAEDRVFLTGFSGGGNLTYHMLIRHPERLAAAVPVCANYFGDAADLGEDRPLTAGEAALPVRLILSEFDTIDESALPGLPWLLGAVVGVSLGVGCIVWRRTGRLKWILLVAATAGLVSVLLIVELGSGIDPQSRAAVRRLRERGYTDVTVTTVPGMGHEPATERVVEICAQLLGPRKP